MHTWGKKKFKFSRQVLLHHLQNKMCETEIFIQTDFIKHIVQLLPEVRENSIIKFSFLIMVLTVKT
jgi:hypothetical protein